MAEEFDLLSLLLIELVDGVPVLQVPYSFGVDVLAQVFGLESLAPFCCSSLVKLLHRKLDVAVGARLLESGPNQFRFC